ncbi:MAG: hypothetical protein R2744_01460 [Bacteroidales bacterium]
MHSACPTGALTFSSGKSEGESHGMIPESTLEPRIDIIPLRNENNPGVNNRSHLSPVRKRKVSPASEWSLILFTFLSSLLFGLSFSALRGGYNTGASTILTLTAITLMIPLAHLGRPLRSWRSILNAGVSPLSNEILFLLAFALLIYSSNLIESPALLTLSFIAGLFLLVSIDSVYTAADRRVEMIFHPGQVFLVGLVMASFFAGESRALLFVLLLQMALNIWIRFIKIRNRFNTITGVVLLILMAIAMTLRSADSPQWPVFA